MSETPGPSGSTVLACMTCETQQGVDLNPGQLAELFNKQQVRLYCPACQTSTTWYAVQPDRRSGQERRTTRHAHIDLPIRVRCDQPDMKFIEFTRTLTASRQGASFTSIHPLREGMVVLVIVPFREGDSTILELQARVVRAEQKGNGCQVGVEFLS